MDIQTELIEKAKEMGIELSTIQAEMFNTYGTLLVDWNEKMNLTAITEPSQVVVKHFVDSLLFLKAVKLNGNEKIIDVGTGAGFPGIPLKIMYPNIELTLLDGLNKRLKFLQTVAEEIGIDVKTVHSRAEDAGKNLQYREKFDIATARAVANLSVLSEYCVPFVKVTGKFVALKGPNVEVEIAQAEKATKILGVQLLENFSFTLNDKEKSQRNITVFEKIKQTPVKYPRHGNKISKECL